MLPEEQLFIEYLKKNNLRYSAERKIILKLFLTTEDHLTLEDLYNLAKKESKKINLSTVYRNMQIFTKLGLALAWKGLDKKTYFEHQYHHAHHDHMICEKCKKIIEFTDPAIEKLQDQAAKKYDFKINTHRLAIYGLCSKCR